MRNQALAALKRLAYEAGELGWIEPGAAARVSAIKSKRVLGTKLGTWLAAEQVGQILSKVDRTTNAGKRDACVLALLIGCGLRRAESCELTTEQIRAVGTEGRLVITNLLGKGGRTRSVAVPEWTAQIIKEWMEQL